MGFCRRCGNIVPTQTIRCKCGGSAVAPIVNWNHSLQKDGGSPDRWAKTYVSAAADPMPAPASSNETEQHEQTSTPRKVAQYNGINQSPTRPSRRFPRPLSTTASTKSITDNRASYHITSTTAQRPPSPAKRNPMVFLGGSPGSTPADVITSPDNATLAKAYGSILQHPDTLPIHTCARCSSIFPPDVTIYPDPQGHSTVAPRFLCRPCFAANGGSKGDCVACGREVLIVTKEGGFVESGGNVWHKRCFRCGGCYKEIGHAPMVDLFGKPSCSQCFDNCLNRKGAPEDKNSTKTVNNIGGLRGRSRESSPAIEELSERLGIKRQVSPNTNRGLLRETTASPSTVAEDHADQLNTLHDDLVKSLRLGKPPSPARAFQSPDNPFCTTATDPVAQAEPTTPDLSSSSSCSDSLSSGTPSTPSNSPRQSSTPTSCHSITPKGKVALRRLDISASYEEKCSRCSLSLFSTSGSGQIVTVPPDSATGVRASYHASCFRCFVCDDVFDGNAQGQAVFIKDSKGPCHPECIAVDKRMKPTRQLSPARAVTMSECTQEQPPKSAPPLSRPFPRFGSSETCPGCCRSVSLMEYGVVPGPQNSRWHATCLVCGGKGSKPPRPGCGKKLDSAARTDRDGGVWCRECMLLLPIGARPSPQGSPTRGTLTPSYTGTGLNRELYREAGKLFGQVTGSTFERTTDMLTKQYTGSLMRGGSVSPTRQMTRSVSPTKGLMPVTRHPRPAGSWKHRSIDEGRGMFLVRQMTGNGQTWK